MDEFITKSPEETEKLAERLGEILDVPALILLQGEMGAGKTAFVRGFARGFGSKDRVNSPTFALANVYQGNKGKINHLDLYRLGSQDEFYETGLESCLDEKAVTLIEWPQIAELGDEADLIITISTTDEINKRKIKLEGQKNLDRILPVLSEEATDEG